jgi:hypothetical protein
MLLPSKHSHPDRTVVASSAVLLKELRNKRVVSFDDLASKLARSTGDSADFLFLPAVGLLHLLGLVEYLQTVDAFEYRGA